VSERARRLAEVARVSAKLGVIGFGGPAAHVAMLRVEVVQRRAWVRDDEFVELLGATSALPGPGSTQMVLAVGRRHAGWPGLVVAGACFIAPAASLVVFLAWLYVRYGRVPAVAGVLYGIKPVVVAIVAAAVWGLGRSVADSGPVPVVVGVGAAAAFLGGVDPLVVLGTGAVVVTVWRNRSRLARLAGLVGGARGPHLVVPVLSSAVVRGATTSRRHVGLGSIVAEFAKLGVIVFGSGYVLWAFLQRDLVHQLHWLGTGRLLDAVAAGQVTPGPVFTTATFVGYLLAGVPGGVLATLAIFLPSFVMVAALGPVLARVRRSPWASGGLAGISAAAVGLMAGVGVILAGKAFVDPLTVVVAVVAAALLVLARLNTAWLVLAGAAIGALHSV